MVADIREVCVFVASPGDCDAERQRVRKVADDVNTALGTTFGLRLSVEGWEQVPPDLGRPQDHINPLVDACDVFVGVLAYRWGSPTGTHDSGFHEEFERVRQRRGDTADPHVALYFKNASKQQLDDPGEQLQAVLAFRARVQNERLALYDVFDEADDLEPKLWRLLTRVLARLHSALPTGQGSSADAAATPESPADEFAGGLIDEARQQIAQTTEAVTLIARQSAAADARPDTDRLLLIALALNPDGGRLPEHVANRLFARRNELAFSIMEGNLWRDTLLADIGHSPTAADRVIPGFGVVVVDDNDLDTATGHDDPNIAAGAFRVLGQTRQRPAALWGIGGDDGEDVARRWVEALGREQVADAALDYLAAVATDSDLTMVDLLLGQTDHDALTAFRGVLAGDPSSAAKLLANTYSPPGWLAAPVTEHLDRVDDDGISALVTSARVDVDLARAAFRELLARSGPDDQTLTALLRRDHGLDVLLGEAEHPGASGIAERLDAIKESLDEKVVAQLDLRVAQLALRSTVEELLDLVANGVIDAWEALGWKRDPRLAERARVMFDTDAAEIVEPLESSEAWRESDVLPFVRWKIRLTALRILVNSGEVTDDDRGRFRTELTAKKGWGDDALRLYLPLATGDDLDLLISQVPNTYDPLRRQVVDTILRVGGSAGARTLLAVAPDKPDAVAAVQALSADPEVADDELRELLYAPHADLRMAALGTLVARLERHHLEDLLARYPNERRAYYYNVIAELDRLLYFDAVVGVPADATA